MGRQQNTVEKRVREMARKRKADEKRVLRREKKERAIAQSTDKPDSDAGEVPNTSPPE